MGTPTPKEASVEVRLPRKARMSQEWPWVSPWGGASIVASPRVSWVVKLVMELHHVSQGGNQGSSGMVELVCGLHHGCSGGDHRSPGAMKLVMELYQTPKMVKLEVGLHQRCYIREHEVSWGGEASDGASPPKM